MGDVETMMLPIVVLLTIWMAGCVCGRFSQQTQGDRDPKPISVCQLFSGLEAYQDKMVVVRGIYFHGLRENHCGHEYSGGGRIWPTVLALADSSDTFEGDERVGFISDRKSWDKLDETAIGEGTQGHCAEVWVTVVGQMRGPQRFIRPGVKGDVGGYDHLGMLPACLVVKRVYDIEVKAIPTYNYREMLPSNKPL